MARTPFNLVHVSFSQNKIKKNILNIKCKEMLNDYVMICAIGINYR